IPIPVILETGTTTVTATGAAYFCADGEEALCLIQQLEIVVPVEVGPDATGGELVVEYRLEPDA
ncbi:MAG: hypothetical protein KC482_13555, partial [Dehalococcoidia bacterium]|nr:hypothetical protein [Dehalococcoidia bacterium]